MKKLSFVYIGFLITVGLLFLYSYTQVDLSLTLSRFSIWQVIQKAFQYIGYFQRPLSGTIYIIILLLLFIFYGLLLIQTSRNKLKRKTLWTLFGITGIVLLFSYNGFSYDIFNYIFDAKIITHYFQNPYMHSALDFPHDPMLSFMHWTQRTYPYGPVWLFLTVPLSFIGLQFFLPTFFLFKALAALAYFVTVFYIEKILQKTNPKEALFGTVLFALNPLILIEVLVSAHIDIAMMAIVVCSFYYLMINKNVRSIILLLLSFGVKFATGFLIPLYLFVFYLYRFHKKINWNIIFGIASIFMATAVVFEALRTNFQPWYFIIVLPFLALLGKKSYGVIPSFVLPIFFLFEYVPFLYRGDWNSPVPMQLTLLTLSGIAVTLLVLGIWKIYKLVLIKK